MGRKSVEEEEEEGRETITSSWFEFAYRPCYFLQQLAQVLLRCLGFRSDEATATTTTTTDLQSDPNTTKKKEKEVVGSRSIAVASRAARRPPRPPVSSGGGGKTN